MTAQEEVVNFITSPGTTRRRNLIPHKHGHPLKYATYSSAILNGIIRVTTWENQFMPCANNKGADQPAHSRSLISAFVVRFLDSI